MRLSTMASMFYRETSDLKNYVECIRRAHEVGFRVIDFNTSFFAKNKLDLFGDDWRRVRLR